MKAMPPDKRRRMTNRLWKKTGYWSRDLRRRDRLARLREWSRWLQLGLVTRKQFEQARDDNYLVTLPMPEVGQWQCVGPYSVYGEDNGHTTVYVNTRFAFTSR